MLFAYALLPCIPNNMYCRFLFFLVETDSRSAYPGFRAIFSVSSMMSLLIICHLSYKCPQIFKDICFSLVVK
jgi:hypothetical protein